MQQSIRIQFIMENTEKNRKQIAKNMNLNFNIPIKEIYDKLALAYSDNLRLFQTVKFDLSFPSNYKEKDIFKKLEEMFPNISCICNINEIIFNHNVNIVNNDINANKMSNDKIIEDPNLFEITLKKGYTIISIEELEKLKRAKNALRDLYKTISVLENELKEIWNDTRTISES